MRKRTINTDIGTPTGPARQANFVVKGGDIVSVPTDNFSGMFILSVKLGTAKKFSFAYDVKSARKKRANLKANKRYRYITTE